MITNDDDDEPDRTIYFIKHNFSSFFLHLLMLYIKFQHKLKDTHLHMYFFNIHTHQICCFFLT